MTDAAEVKPATPAPKEPQERIVVTEHSRVIGGKKLEYTATCGTVVLRDFDADDDSKERQEPRRQVARHDLLHGLHAEGCRRSRKSAR